MTEDMKVPQHIAIILDGNGRWATKKHMPRNYGHAQGSKTVEQICEAAYKMGVKYLTVYAFSTENWSRPEDEVAALMNLLRSYMKDCLKISTKNNMRVRIIGDCSRLDCDLQESIATLQEASKNNTGLNFQVAINYGGRDEIVRAVRKIITQIDCGIISKEQIDEELIQDNLDTVGIPDPDLLIRTAGEQRVSNFLTWQLSYTEFYVTDVLWPDFNKEDLQKAIEFYNSRTRKFGGLKK
jgi:undecaprenyl diphosphate synthase